MGGDNPGFNHTNGHDSQFFQDQANNNVQPRRATDLLVSVSACTDAYKSRIIDLAFAANEEVRIMAQEREPLWLFNIDMGTEALNVTEYRRRFTPVDPALDEIMRLITVEHLDVTNPSGQPENRGAAASRATGLVFRNPVSLVNVLMDVEKWSAMFSNIVSKATSVVVLCEGRHESPDARLQVIRAEFHLSSPVMKTPEIYFARCSRQIDINTWVVADVSLETIFPSPAITFQRKPSGCIIQSLQDGLSSVTWVEHNTDCNGVENRIFKGLLESGLAFSARRWLSSLERQCDRIATLDGQNDTLNYLPENGYGYAAAKKGLLKLAGRMVRHFNFNNFSNLGSEWARLPVPGSEDILIKTRFNLDELEIPRGLAVSIAASIWLPVKQNEVFNFLRSEQNRSKWDILSHGLLIQDIVCISSSRNSIDCVSVVSVEPSSTRPPITYLKESFSDSVADYLVYAPVDVPTMQHILQGGSTDKVAILPSGFAVLPGGLTTESSILTIGFQIMDEQLSQPKELPPQYLFTSYGLMKETISRIWTALMTTSRNM